MKRVYRIQGIDCPNCAAKLERALNKVPGVTLAQIDFLQQRLVLEMQQEDVLERVMAEAARVEPGCSIVSEHASAAQPAHCVHGCSCGHDHDHHTHGEACHAHHGHDHQHDHDHCCGNHDDHHHHDHGHDHHAQGGGVIVRAAVAAVLVGLGLLVQGSIGAVLMAAAYIVAGWDIVLAAGRNILKGQVFDEQFLMAVASIGACCIGEFAEAALVMILYQIGEWLQGRAVGKSRRSIAELMDLRPDHATVLRNGTEQQVDPATVAVGEIIMIRAGEKLPLDGVVVKGISALDTSRLTGESMPREVAEGNAVLAGSVNQQGLLHVRVTQPYGESTASKILQLVEESSAHKAQTERFITRFARVYTPVVCLAAVALAVVPSLVDGQWLQWLHRALNFLVISCPCALVISVPLTFFSGVGAASARGVLIKGANYVEALARVDTVVFDKTGTLTQGRLTVADVQAKDGNTDALLALAAQAERYSAHPIARALLAAADLPEGDKSEVVEEFAGFGVKAVINGCSVCVGNERLMAQCGVMAETVQAVGTAVHVAKDGRYMGYIVLADQLKDDAAKAIAALRKLGVRDVAMLTGDRTAVAQQMADRLALTQVHAELLPQDKVTHVAQLVENSRGGVAFAGDGVNDAPALARADVGMAMGAIGSDAAIEAADVVLMHDSPSQVATAIAIARDTVRIARQNIAFSLAVKALVMLLSILGCANMWLAVFADVGVCMLAIANAMRAGKKDG